MAKSSKKTRKAIFTKDYSEAAKHKLEEAQFFLTKLEESLFPGETPSAEAEAALRYYASAFLSAARGPINLFLNRNAANYGKRQNWHGQALRKHTAIRDMGILRDFNVHQDRVPEVVHFTKRFDFQYSQTLDPIHNNRSVMQIFREGLAKHLSTWTR